VTFLVEHVSKKNLSLLILSYESHLALGVVAYLVRFVGWTLLKTRLVAWFKCQKINLAFASSQFERKYNSKGTMINFVKFIT
jgi:hypothetical protein